MSSAACCKMVKMASLPNLFVLSNRRRLFPFLSFGFLVLSLIVTTALVQVRQDIRKRAAEESHTAIFKLSAVGKETNTFAARPGEVFGVVLSLEPNSERGVSAVDVVLEFDHNLLELEDVEPNYGGNFKVFAPTAANGIDFDESAVIGAANTGGALEGVIRFGAVAYDFAAEELSEPQILPISPLATLTFRVKDTERGGTAVIRFGEKGFIEVGSTEDSNALQHTISNDVVDILDAPTTEIEVTVSASAAGSCQLLFGGASARLGFVCGDSDYDPAYDVDKDCDIDVNDTQIIFDHCGDDNWCQSQFGGSGVGNFDIDGSGAVDFQDLKALVRGWGEFFGASSADVSGDGVVNGFDFGLLCARMDS